jgi:hypothetical protein
MLDRCNCYVRGLSSEVQFCLRLGAHSTQCPVYRRSRDPIDHAKDETYRRDHERFGNRVKSLKGGSECT